MTTRLQSLLHHSARAIEPADVFAAFRRIARQRWGSVVPYEPVRYGRGVLTVRCSSPLWRTELLYSTDWVKETLLHDLPVLTLNRVTVLL